MSVKVAKIEDPMEVVRLVEELETEHENALFNFEHARAEMGEASLLVKKNAPGAEAKLSRAEKAWEKARTEVAKKESAIEAARAHYGEVITAHHEAVIDERWKKTEEIVVHRNELAVQIEQEAASLVEKVKQIMRLGVEAHETSPSKDMGLGGSSLSLEEVEGAFRSYLRKLGFKWASNWAFGDHSIPQFTQRVQEGNAWILSKKPSSEKTQPGVAGGQDFSSGV